MKLRVVFTDDPTGMSKDITKEIDIPSEECLYDIHDKTNRLYNLIKTTLEYQGFDFSYFPFTLWKVYVI